MAAVFRRPKHNRPFGDSGGFWVINTRKFRTINKDKDENVLCVNAQLQRVYMICFFIFYFSDTIHQFSYYTKINY